MERSLKSIKQYKVEEIYHDLYEIITLKGIWEEISEINSGHYDSF